MSHMIMRLVLISAVLFSSIATSDSGLDEKANQINAAIALGEETDELKLLSKAYRFLEQYALIPGVPESEISERILSGSLKVLVGPLRKSLAETVHMLCANQGAFSERKKLLLGAFNLAVLQDGAKSKHDLLVDVLAGMIAALDDPHALYSPPIDISSTGTDGGVEHPTTSVASEPQKVMGPIKVARFTFAKSENVVLVIRVDFFSRPDVVLLPQLLSTVGSAKGDEYEYVIIDVRANPGGMLSAAEMFSDLFLPEGSAIAEQILKNGSSLSMVASSARFASQAKQIVLVDRWTASASEIVAKSLQKNGAVVIGEKTYGKGTGQQPILLGPAGQFGALKFTVSQMSVGGELLDHVGVHPDIPAITDADDWRYCSGTTDLHREICSQISNLPITRIVYE